MYEFSANERYQTNNLGVEILGLFTNQGRIAQVFYIMHLVSGPKRSPVAPEGSQSLAQAVLGRD